MRPWGHWLLAGTKKLVQRKEESAEEKISAEESSSDTFLFTSVLIALLGVREPETVFKIKKKSEKGCCLGETAERREINSNIGALGPCWDLPRKKKGSSVTPATFD